MNDFPYPLYKVLSVDDKIKFMQNMFSNISVASYFYNPLDTYRGMLATMYASYFKDRPDMIVNDLLTMMKSSNLLQYVEYYESQKSKSKSNNAEVDPPDNLKFLDRINPDYYKDFIRYTNELKYAVESYSFKGLYSLLQIENNKTFTNTVVSIDKYLKTFAIGDVEFCKKLRKKIEINEGDELIPEEDINKYFKNSMQEITYVHLAEFMLYNGLYSNITLIKARNEEKVYALLQFPSPTTLVLVADKSKMDYDGYLEIHEPINLGEFDYGSAVRILQVFYLTRWG
ncbi:MAG: hypothetical protein JHC30_06320 [Caldisericum sp.]|nr:hypothetical protein [Caldisericum sp.]